jgi:UDP-N-acetyl-D-glucosamine dehydrogenase
MVPPATTASPAVASTPNATTAGSSEPSREPHVTALRLPPRKPSGQARYDTAVVGLGYVGLPLCLAFARSGATALGIDTDGAKVDSLAAGRSYIKHIAAADVVAATAARRFRATSDFREVAEAASVLICVPTPLTANRTPDLAYVANTARSLAPHLRRGQLVVLESTTYPGTTEEIVKPILEQGSGLVAGRDFHLAFSPEREDPGNPRSRLSEVPKVVGGLTPACRDRAAELYRRIVKDVVPVSSCGVAEATKLTENIFRAVNIALVNELKVIYSQMGIDVWEVIDAAATKPFGYMPFYPGPGLGGHCIPIDPFYLTWKALEYGQRTRLIELAGEINTAMPEYVVARVIDALNDAGKPVRDSQVLLLGLAYKANVDDDRESPTYEIMKLLEKRGAVVAYNDPHVPVIQAGRSHHDVAGRRSRPITADHDVMVLCTAHEDYRTFDFASLGVPLVDCRNFATCRPAAYYRA